MNSHLLVQDKTKAVSIHIQPPDSFAPLSLYPTGGDKTCDLNPHKPIGKVGFSSAYNGIQQFDSDIRARQSSNRKWVGSEFQYRPGLGGYHEGDMNVNKNSYKFNYNKNKKEKQQKITNNMVKKIEGVQDAGQGGSVLKHVHEGGGQLHGYQIPIKQESTLKKLQQLKEITDVTLGAIDPSGLYQAGYQRQDVVDKKVKETRLKKLMEQRKKLLTDPYDSLKNNTSN